MEEEQIISIFLDGLKGEQYLVLTEIEVFEKCFKFVKNEKTPVGDVNTIFKNYIPNITNVKIKKFLESIHIIQKNSNSVRYYKDLIVC